MRLNICISFILTLYSLVFLLYAYTFIFFAHLQFQLKFSGNKASLWTYMYDANIFPLH